MYQDEWETGYGFGPSGEAEYNGSASRTTAAARCTRPRRWSTPRTCSA